MKTTETAHGRFEIRRTEGEPPFALMLAPRYHRMGKTWAIHYRSATVPHFDETNRNVSHLSRKNAESELAYAVKHSTPYQLGLVRNPGEKLPDSTRPTDEPSPAALRVAELIVPSIDSKGRTGKATIPTTWGRKTRLGIAAMIDGELEQERALAESRLAALRALVDACDDSIQWCEHHSADASGAPKQEALEAARTVTA